MPATLALAPTADAPTAADPPAEGPVAQRVEYLPLDRIDPDPDQDRKTFEPGPLRQLAASVRATGLLQAVTVRPNPERPGRYLLLWGERRWRAHGAFPAEGRGKDARPALAALPTIGAVVRTDLDDPAARRAAQITENLQRAELPPVQEARGFRALLDGGLSAAEVGAKVGKPAWYVRQRAALTTLVPKALEALAIGRLTVAAALELARVDEAAQRSTLDALAEYRRHERTPTTATAKEVREHLERTTFLPLAKAPFERKDAALVPAAGACTKCPKRTGADGDLFADFEKRDDRCLDRACYQGKLIALASHRLADATARAGGADDAPFHGRVHRLTTRYSYEIRGRGQGPEGGAALPQGDWFEIDPAEPRYAACPASLGVVDHDGGARAGAALVVCARPDGCRDHWPSSRAGGSPADLAAKTREKTKATVAERALLAAAARAVVERAPIAAAAETGGPAVTLPGRLLVLVAAQASRELQDEARKAACRILGLDFARTGRGMGEARAGGAGGAAGALGDARPVPLDPGVYGAREHYSGSAQAIVEHLAALDGAGDYAGVARVLVVLALAGEAHGSEWGSDRGERIRALAQGYGVDLAALYRTVAAQVAPKRAPVAPDTVQLPACPKCGTETASFLTKIDGKCSACRTPEAGADGADHDDDAAAEDAGAGEDDDA